MTRFLSALVFLVCICAPALMPQPAHAGGIRFNNPFAKFENRAMRGPMSQQAQPAPAASIPARTASINDYAVPVPRPRPSGLYIAAAEPVPAVETTSASTTDNKIAAAPAPVSVIAETPAPKVPMNAQDRAEAKIMSSVVLGGTAVDEPAKQANKESVSGAPQASPASSTSLMFSAKPTSAAMMGNMPSLGLTAPAPHSGLGVLMSPDTQSLAVKD